MGKFIDLTGQTFNRWTVIKRAENRGKEVYWQCQCECGNIKDVKSYHLRHGASKSCGCLQKEIAKQHLSEIGKNNTNDLTNKTFNFLTVIKDSGKRGSNGCIIWECKCICGNKREVASKHLTSNEIISCGCKKRKSKGEEKIFQILQKENIPFETQKSFETCRFPDTNALAKFDFYVDNKYLIEYDGEQHYYYKNSGWLTEEHFQRTQERDKFKTKWCEENNIPLIRIPYTKYKNLTINDLIL